MSAFVVEDKTINNIVGWLNNSEREHGAWLLELVLQVCEVSRSDEDWQGKVGISMFQMNVDAVRARYKDADEAKMIPPSYKFAWELATDVQVLKSLQCWLYQCSEEGIPERPLYKAFREVERVIASSIVSRMEVYDRATWG